MTILSSIVAKVRKYTNSGKSAITHMFGDSAMKVKYYDPGVYKSFQEIVVLTRPDVLPDAIAESISTRLLEEMKNEARKFQSSGDLVESLELRNMGAGRYRIDSDSVYKLTWLRTENQGIPPVASLLSWMEERGVVAGENQKLKKRTAFAIQRSFATGAGAGSSGLSVLRKLDSSGNRMYDYPRAALESIKPEIRMVGSVFKEIL
jgi:hypothetical protein